MYDDEFELEFSDKDISDFGFSGTEIPDDADLNDAMWWY